MLNDHTDCKVLCVSEHWKSEDQICHLAIEDFKLVSKFCRKEGQHGGSAVYVRRNVRCKVRTKLSNLSVSGVFECAAVEVKLRKADIIIVTVYRPPTGDIGIFLDKIEQLLVHIFEEQKLVFITGDFNIELIKENKIKTELLSIMNSFRLTQTVFENTRITQSTSSCIDNIFTNSEFVETLIIENFVSDHTAQKIIFNAETVINNNFKYKRFFSDQNKDDFLCSLREQDWLNVYSADPSNVNIQWNSFMNTFINIFNQHFPLKLVREHKTRQSHNNSLRDDELSECKRRLDILVTLSKCDIRYKETYNNVKKEYDNILKKIRAKTYENRIKNSDNKTKCMWTICNEITGRSNNNFDIGIKGNAEEIPDKYNEYLLSVIPELLENLEKHPFSSNIIENNQSMYLTPVTAPEICELAKRLKNKHSSGIDEIPSSIVKLSVNEISSVLCYVINNSFKYGIFPDYLKIALIKPLYKKGDSEMMENYRPISLLPGFSKLFELVMSTRLLNFMNKCDLFSESQHGYLKGRSTQTAIFQFIQAVLRHLENGDLALGMFLDLSKAYDCLDKDLLISKLEMYGVRGNSLQWFISYLSDRQQKVTITKGGANYSSKIMPNKVGIAQGSIIGPILFIVFVNDLRSITDDPNQNIINYADDTNLVLGCKDNSDILINGKDFLENINNWFTKNKLIVNKEKTNIILFRTKLCRVEKPTHLTGEERLDIVENTKFLGIHINEFLDWSCHINYLSKKLNSICYGIRLVSKYMNEKTLKIMYFANFESIIKYGIIFWGGDSQIQNIFVIQKRLIRIVKKMNYNETCRTVFKSEGIMTVYALYIYECLMFLFVNKDRFNITTHHQHDTRTMSLNYPIHRLTLTEKSPHYMCIKLFNKLPDNVKMIQSQKLFKSHIRKFLTDLEPYSINDFLTC